jgi:hypothetical protein
VYKDSTPSRELESLTTRDPLPEPNFLSKIGHGLKSFGKGIGHAITGGIQLAGQAAQVAGQLTETSQSAFGAYQGLKGSFGRKGRREFGEDELVGRYYSDFEVYVLHIASCEIVIFIWSHLVVHRMEELASREPESEWSAEDGMIKREESFELSERDNELYVFCSCPLPPPLLTAHHIVLMIWQVVPLSCLLEASSKRFSMA